MHGAGVERIVTTQAWEMYSEWMKEVEKINFPELLQRNEEGDVVARALRLLPHEQPKMLTGANKENTKC